MANSPSTSDNCRYLGHSLSKKPVLQNRQSCGIFDCEPLTRPPILPLYQMLASGLHFQIFCILCHLVPWQSWAIKTLLKLTFSWVLVFIFRFSQKRLLFIWLSIISF